MSGREVSWRVQRSAAGSCSAPRAELRTLSLLYAVETHVSGKPYSELLRRAPPPAASPASSASFSSSSSSFGASAWAGAATAGAPTAATGGSVAGVEAELKAAASGDILCRLRCGAEKSGEPTRAGFSKPRRRRPSTKHRKMGRSWSLEKETLRRAHESIVRNNWNSTTAASLAVRSAGRPSARRCSPYSLDLAGADSRVETEGQHGSHIRHDSPPVGSGEIASTTRVRAGHGDPTPAPPTSLHRTTCRPEAVYFLELLPCDLITWGSERRASVLVQLERRRADAPSSRSWPPQPGTSERSGRGRRSRTSIHRTRAGQSFGAWRSGSTGGDGGPGSARRTVVSVAPGCPV